MSIRPSSNDAAFSGRYCASCGVMHRDGEDCPPEITGDFRAECKSRLNETHSIELSKMDDGTVHVEAEDADATVWLFLSPEDVARLRAWLDN
jgi:hypothetical protein